MVKPLTTSNPSYSSNSVSPPVTSRPTVSAAAKTGASTFDDLWTTSLSSIGTNTNGPGSGVKPTPQGGVQGKTIRDLEQEKALNQLWGSGTTTTAAGAGASTQKSAGGGFDDLLL
jgi:hypothetical protein